MPTYVYECEKCGSRVEVFQKMSEEPLKLCSKCNENTLRRVLSGGISINFKGTGFYATDHKAPHSSNTHSASHASSCSCSSCSSSSCSSCGK